MGETKNPLYLPKNQEYSEKFLNEYFPKDVKVEGMVHFDLCYALLDNAMLNSEVSQIFKICNLPKKRLCLSS